MNDSSTVLPSIQNIDFIGDIHGYAKPLKDLLVKLGYDYYPEQNLWKHQTRKACFLGDYIDRGDEQLEVITIVKNMVEAGHAYAIMGNHELNAIAWHTQTKDTSEDTIESQFLRPHTDKNRRQHSAFLDQLTENSPQHNDSVAWFYTLPLWLDFGGMRVVHACWHEPSMEVLTPYLDENNRMRPAHIEQIYDDADLFGALETITKGIETDLPTGYSYADKDGHIRTATRLKWWPSDNTTYRDAAVISEKDRQNLPDIPLEAELGYTDETPVVFGHYWMTGTPEIFTPYTACLDWSIAAKQSVSRKLCAYRWHGEKRLCNDNLVWVSL